MTAADLRTHPDWPLFQATVDTGMMHMDFPTFHRMAEQLLGRRIWEPHFQKSQVWAELRAALDGARP